MADLLLAASKLRRSVFPSMATICPWVISCRAVIQLSRHFSNSAGSSVPRTRLKQSCDGMPALWSRNCESHFFFLSPYSAIETKSPAPQMTAHRAIVTMLISRYVASRRRGSLRSEK
jgi:hypothetical protein